MSLTAARRTVLALSGITLRFGSLVANDDISLELREGETLALLGENGAGKSTLVSILFGHYVADSGSIEVFGKPLPPGSCWRQFCQPDSAAAIPAVRTLQVIPPSPGISRRSTPGMGALQDASVPLSSTVMVSLISPT